jgi:hypothetical protein
MSNVTPYQSIINFSSNWQTGGGAVVLTLLTPSPIGMHQYLINDYSLIESIRPQMSGFVDYQILFVSQNYVDYSLSLSTSRVKPDNQLLSIFQLTFDTVD